jgi:N-acetylmuramoyl-L-alanine amidase
MDSSVDVPIILSEAHANKTAQGILNFLVGQYKLGKTVSEDGTIYKVQVGAFADKERAEALKERLKGYGYEAVIVSGS